MKIRLKCLVLSIVVPWSCGLQFPQWKQFVTESSTRTSQRQVVHGSDNLLSEQRRSLMFGFLLMGWTGESSFAMEEEQRPRWVDVGGGTDLQIPRVVDTEDVLYPISMEGMWKVDRIVNKVDGDFGQADVAWRLLAGGGNIDTRKVVTYYTRFIKPPDRIQSNYPIIPSVESGISSLPGVMRDRGFELQQRAGEAFQVGWDPQTPNNIELINPKKRSLTSFTVVQRTVEWPTEQGFGFSELYRISEPSGLLRAIQVKRRYRRGFDPEGNRTVDGLEIVKTFRVLDGIAGTEFPTSSTTSRLRLTRPKTSLLQT